MTKIDILRREPPEAWIAALAESEAQLAAGPTVPGDEIMRELHESVTRLEDKHPGEPKREIAPRR